MRGLIGLEDWVQVEVRSLEKYLSTSKDKTLKKVSRIRIIENTKYGRSKEEIHKEHQEKYEGKPLHGRFRKATEEVRSKRSWDWLNKGYLKKETESNIVVAQDQTRSNVQGIWEMWFMEKMFNPSVVHMVLLMKQLHILFQNAQNYCRRSTNKWDMTALPKCFIGSYVKNGDSVKQINGTYTSQKKLYNLRTARSCGISLYRLTTPLSIIDQI